MTQPRMTAQKLADDFNEHVLYELLMLRYTAQRLLTEPPKECRTQLLWNAMFAAFNVSARNLYDFLNGDDKQNIRLVDYRPYCPRFDFGSIDPIRSTKDLLHDQCLHLGRKRTAVAANKISHDRIQTLAEWIDSRMKNLIESFNEDIRPRIKPERANPDHAQNMVFSWGPTGPRAPTLSPTTATPGETHIMSTGFPTNQD